MVKAIRNPNKVFGFRMVLSSLDHFIYVRFLYNFVPFPDHLNTGPFENQTHFSRLSKLVHFWSSFQANILFGFWMAFAIPNQNFKKFGFGMVFRFPSLDFE